MSYHTKETGPGIETPYTIEYALREAKKDVDPNINPNTGKRNDPNARSWTERIEELEANLGWGSPREEATLERTLEPILDSFRSRLNKPDYRKLECSECGAAAEASCDCQADYKSVPGERARKAVEANPDKSDRAIAEEIGVSKDTVRRARNKTTVANAPVRNGETETGANAPVQGGQASTVPHGTVQAAAESSPVERRVGLDGKTRKMPAFKPKIDVASPVTTDDLAEAELSVVQRQKVEAAFELRLKTHKQQLEIEYKQYFQQMIHDYEQQFEQRKQELERQFEQRLKEEVNKHIDEWQREMCE